MGLGLSGLRLGLGQQLWGTVWSPAKLFPTGTEVGLFLDFSDISTLYTDQNFSTNISAIGDPVGGVIDKSGNGNHLIQATAAARPIWTRHPKSGVRNLLNGSDSFAGGNVTVTAVPHTISTADSVTITLSGASTAGPLVGPGELQFTPSAGTLTLAMSGAGDVQVELGSTATAYQTRVSQYNVTEAGVDDCYGLTFDGVDDYMATAAAVDFGSPSTATLTVGQSTSVAHVGYVFTFGGSTRPRLSVSQETNRWRSAARPSLTGGGSTDTTASSAPSAAVVSVLASVSAGNSHRIDGEEYGTTSAGTGVFSQNTNIFIGKSWIVAYYLTGTIYGVTLTDYILDAEQLAALEAWTAANTPEVTLA